MDKFRLKAAFCFLLSTSCFFYLYSQNNRLTTERGELLWQYNQHIEKDSNNQNTVIVTFVFINGIQQTAFTLRQERFASDIVWLDTTNFQVEKEDRVELITANLAPKESIIFKYSLQPKKNKDNELVAERSAILIMNEEFEIRKEYIPEQSFFTKEVKIRD